MTNKSSSEHTFSGHYNDAGDDVYDPKVGDKRLANHIAKELEPYEGKKVKVTISISVEEID